MKPECTFAMQRNQCWMATYCMTQIIWHFGKDKNVEKLKNSVVVTGSGRKWKGSKDEK